MNKIKRIIITSTAIVLLSYGISFTLCETKKTMFNRYLKKNQVDYLDDLLICAHRGYSSLGVENTYQAINLAAKEKYIDYIEMDARMTKDGEIVLSHNDVIFNTKELPVRVSDLIYDDATTMNFKYKTIVKPNYFWYDGEEIMINSRSKDLNNQYYNLLGLAEGIKTCNDKKVIIDLKFNNDIIKFTDKLKEIIPLSSNIIVQSFDIEGIIYLQEHSDFDCMLLIDNKVDFEYIKYFKRVAIEKSLITDDLVKELMDNGITIAIWTINNSEDLEKVLEMVNEYYKNIIYITNYPDLILTKINEKKLVKTL